MRRAAGFITACGIGFSKFNPQSCGILISCMWRIPVSLQKGHRAAGLSMGLPGLCMRPVIT